MRLARYLHTDCADVSHLWIINAKEKATLPRPKKRRHAHWAVYLWPGLAHLWIRGSVAGLALALAFSVLLNVLILGTLVWPAWLELRLKFICAGGVALLWVAALWETRGELRRLEQERQALDKEGESSELPGETSTFISESNPDDELLAEAQKAYLLRDWVTAEQLYRKAIRVDRRAIEARLGYATLLRRIGRLRQARRRLDRLALLDAAQDWHYEIDKERELITNLESQNNESEDLADVSVETSVAIENDATGLELQESASAIDEPRRQEDKLDESDEIPIFTFELPETAQPKPPEAA